MALTLDKYCDIYCFKHLAHILTTTNAELVIFRTKDINSMFAFTNNYKTLCIALSMGEYIMKPFPSGITRD